MTELKQLIESIKKNFEDLTEEQRHLGEDNFEAECKEIIDLEFQCRVKPNVSEACRQQMLRDLATITPALKERIDRYKSFKATVQQLEDRYKTAELALAKVKGYYYAVDQGAKK